jgi:hypothetical protein
MTRTRAAIVAAGVLSVATPLHADTEPSVSYRPPTPPAYKAAPADAAVPIEVWVDLSEPALATLPRDRAEERVALRRRIERQQADVMAQLKALGAVEIARVQQVRNSLAVRLPAGAVPRVREIPGVRSVRPVQNIKRDGTK